MEKGFFASLFDIDFDSFVTTKIVKILYVIAIVLSAIYTIFLIAASFASDSAAGVVVLVLSPVIFLLFVLYSRVLLEFMIVVFRIYENTRGLSQMAPGYGPPPTMSPIQPKAPGPPPGPEAP